ncbi:MAG: hypothetical protein MUE81_11540 [Thermoflexibacter sp.]|jgi:hypothetical protein|nr:hypothetical protein [Thermoflexibacter sp.]
MKSLQRLIVFAVMSLFIVACGSGNNDENSTTEITAQKPKVDWNDAKIRDKVMRIIDKHFVDNTLRQSLLLYQFQDNVKGKPVYFSLGKIEQDSIYPLSEKRTFMKVHTKTDKGDSLVFDYEVSVIPAKEKADSLVYTVESLNLRKFNEEQRYILKKEGNFWIKEILAIAQ